MTNSFISKIGRLLKHIEDAVGTPSGDARERERRYHTPIQREHM